MERPQPARARASRCARAATIAGALAASLSIVLVGSSACAQDAGSAPSQPIVTLVAVGALAILPFLFMTTTSFLRS